jgi:DNA-binding beta-propeller fold protein YncE
VAVRTATKAKIMAAKRRHRELAGGTRPSVACDPAGSDHTDWSELRPVIDAELARLPDHLRAAVVLCDLGGKSRSEAARELGWPEGTLATRLAKARELLAARLTRRGVTLSAAGVATMFASGAAVAAVPPGLASAVLAAVGGSASAVPASVQTLAEGVVRGMYTSYWKLGTVVMLTMAFATAGAVMVAAPGGRAGPASPTAGPPTRPADVGGKPPADPPPVVEKEQDLWVWRERLAPADPAGPILAVAFSPDGRAFVAVTPERRISLSDSAKTAILWTVVPTAPRDAAGVAFSPDGTTLAYATNDGIGFLHAATGKAEPPPLELPKGTDPLAIAFSPDGRRLAVSDGRSFRVDDLPPAQGSVSFGPLAGAPKLTGLPPAAVAWSPDGKRILFLPNNKIDPTWPSNGVNRPDPAKATHWYAQIWGAGSGESMEFLKHGTAQITAAGWSSDGSTIVTADTEGTIVVWDGKAFAEKARIKAPGGVTALAVRADGKRIAVGVTGAKPRDPKQANSAPVVVVWTQWDPAQTWSESSTMGGPPGQVVRALAFSPDGKILVAGTEGAVGNGSGLRVWDRVPVRTK